MSECLTEVYEKTEKVVERKIGSAIVLVPLRPANPNNPHIFSLEGVGKNIWQLIDGKKSIGGIVKELLHQFSIEESQLLADVLEFIEKLKAIGGVQICQPAQISQK